MIRLTVLICLNGIFYIAFFSFTGGAAMDTLTEQLHRSPKLGLYYRDIRAILHEERKKRKQFYEDVREDQKAEFINGEVIVHSPVRIEHQFSSNSVNVLLRSYSMIHDLGQNQVFKRNRYNK